MELAKKSVCWGLSLLWVLGVGWPSVGLAATRDRDLAVMPKVVAGSIPIAGDYWALIVGIDKYKYVPPLETAVKDATAVRDVLVGRYGFRAERITLLLNEQATREGIEEALYRLGKQAGQSETRGLQGLRERGMDR